MKFTCEKCGKVVESQGRHPPYAIYENINGGKVWRSNLCDPCEREIAINNRRDNAKNIL